MVYVHATSQFKMLFYIATLTFSLISHDIAVIQQKPLKMAAHKLLIMAEGSDRFSTLPREIRTMVYRYVFHGSNLLTETIFNSRRHVHPSQISKITSILRVNRQCYAEALPLLYNCATFTIRNVFGWRTTTSNLSVSRWTGPTTARIQHLVITRSTPCGNPPSLGNVFPSLSSVSIELFGSVLRKLSLCPPPKAKVNLAATVLMLYDQMCNNKLSVMEAQPFNDMLFKITEDARDWWIVVALRRRIEFGEGRDQYDMCLKVDLTDAIPWVKKWYGATSAARRCSGGRIVGTYQPDKQQWSFNVNGRIIVVPELLEPSYWDGMDEMQ